MAEVYDTSEFRNGLKILYDGDPFEIIEFQHVKPGKGSAFVRTRIRNLLTGRVLEPTLKSGDTLHVARESATGRCESKGDRRDAGSSHPATRSGQTVGLRRYLR